MKEGQGLAREKMGWPLRDGLTSATWWRRGLAGGGGAWPAGRGLAGTGGPGQGWGWEWGRWGWGGGGAGAGGPAAGTHTQYTMRPRNTNT